MSTLWALPRMAFSQPIDDTQTTHEQPPCPTATPPSDSIYIVQDTTVIGGGLDGTGSSLDDHLGAIWLSPGLVEMSEPEEEASEEHEIAATGLLHCDTSGSDDSKPYGWLEGTDFSTDVGDTNKKRNTVSEDNKRRHTNPPSLLGKGGGSPAWPKLPTPTLHLGAIHKYQE